jgi:hypothetical protein
MDPIPTFHPDADPDPDPSFKKRHKYLKKRQIRLIFNTFWLDICKLIRIRFRIQLINFDWMRIWMQIQVTKILRILHDADPDPQHWGHDTAR